MFCLPDKAAVIQISKSSALKSCHQYFFQSISPMMLYAAALLNSPSFFVASDADNWRDHLQHSETYADKPN